MSNLSFSDFEYSGKRKQTRRERFLAEKGQVVPWHGLLELIEPYYPNAGGCRKPYPWKPCCVFISCKLVFPKRSGDGRGAL